MGESNITTRINLTLGTKGGVGKTTIMLHLADWIKTLDIPLFLMDLDDNNKSLKRYFPEALLASVNDEDQVDQLVIRAAESNHPVILADLKAGVESEMLTWFEGLPFDELQSRGIRITGWGCVTTDPDSISTLLNWGNHIGNRIDYILVQNQKDGADIPEMEDIREGKAFVEQCNPKRIFLPHLKSKYQSEMNRRSLTLNETIHSTSPIPQLTNIMMRHKLRTYQKAIFEQFAALQDIILPD